MHDDDPLAPRTRVARPLRRGLGAPRMAGQVVRLQAAIADYVGDRRAAGVPLDRVLAEVRGLVRHAEAAEGSPDELGILDERVARWATEAYLDEPEPRGVPRFD